jgi:ligand-binding SRPBCC domain-containing protein
MSKGTLIEYRIKLSGIPFNWKTEILAWEPPFRFIDSQIKGPYKIWIHEHTFEFIDGKTVMTDTVEFLSPGWIFEPIINKVFVEKKVKEIFEYRTKVLNDIFS